VEPTVEVSERLYSNETTTSVTKFVIIKHYNIYNVNKLLISNIIARSYNKCSN